MSKQPPPAPTASTVGPCPTVIQIVGRPGAGSLPSTIAPPDHPLHRCKIDFMDFGLGLPSPQGHSSHTKISHPLPLPNHLSKKKASKSAKYRLPQCRTQGGAKGAHAPPPPEAPTRHTLPPEKKLIFDLMTPQASCKDKWYQCELLILIQYLRNYRV